MPDPPPEMNTTRPARLGYVAVEIEVADAAAINIDL
jgi:hypothetical protein